MLRVVLVDDEPLARRGLRRMLAAHTGVGIVGEAEHAAAAVDLIRQVRPDAVFLDIGLPELPGFEILRHLRPPPAIVVVTASAEHAVRAFSVDAVDFLLKPIFPERLAEAVLRLEKSLGRMVRAEAPDPSVIRLRAANRVVVVPPDRLVAALAEGDFCRVLIEQSSAVLASQPLKDLERDLPAPPFLRLSRSMILNSRRIREVRYQAGGRSQVALEGCREPLPLGRIATARLRAWAG